MIVEEKLNADIEHVDGRVECRILNIDNIWFSLSLSDLEEYQFTKIMLYDKIFFDMMLHSMIAEL